MVSSTVKFSRNFTAFIAAVLLLIPSAMFAQTTSKDVKAVLQGPEEEPIPFATVSLTKKGETKPAKYVLSGEKGEVNIQKVASGTYKFAAELLGYKKFEKEITVGKESINIGTIKMELDQEALDAASVSAVGNPIVIKKDTIEYNASSFKTAENAVLEDLLKKLPGVEIGDDGSITVNGESVKKITIEGKTFFLDDPQVASKNIPARMVQKLKVIRKKSEQSEFTGIDDGEEETVLDLGVKPGMMKGLIGNVSAGAGHDIPADNASETVMNIPNDYRYTGNAFVGSFREHTQLSLILNANNANNAGSTNRAGAMMGAMMGGGGMMGRGGGFGGGAGGNGITTSYMAGVNGAWDLFDERMELGGNYMFNHSNNYVEQGSFRRSYTKEGYDLINVSPQGANNMNTNKSYGHSIGMRLDHKFSDNTSILFQPQISFGTGSYTQKSLENTYVDNYTGSYLDNLKNIGMTDNIGDNKSISTSGRFLLRQRLGIPGRTLTANINYNFSNNVLNGINRNTTDVFDIVTGEKDMILSKAVNQDFNNVQRSASLSGALTYTEPLGNNFYLQANYSYNWSRSQSDKKTYDLDNNRAMAYDYSNYVVNENTRQNIGVTAMYQKGRQFSAQAGFAAMPNKTYNSTSRYNESGERVEVNDPLKDFRWNFSPTLQVRGDFSDNLSGRINYRGQSSQPSTSQLMPVPDNTNPLRVSFGNSQLTPYFSHNFSGDLRFSNRQRFSSFNLRFSAGMVQNPIVSMTWYGTNGGQYSMPFNGKNTANGSLGFFGNIPLDKKGMFSISNNTNGNWNMSNSYVGRDIDMSTYLDSQNGGFYAFMDEFERNLDDKKYYKDHITENTVNTINVSENLSFIYRGESIQLRAGGRTRYNKSWYSVSSTNQNTETWNSSVNASATWTWDRPGLSFDADYNYRWYNGYATPQPSEHILNAEISKSLLKRTMTIAVRAYDILGMSKNLTVSDSANYHTETVNNTLGRYIIFSLTWRFGSFGGNRGGNRAPGGNRGPGGMPGGMGRGMMGPPMGGMMM